MARSARKFAAIYFLGCSLLVLGGSLLPSGNGFVAVFAKPWGESAVEVIARAEGRIIFGQNASWVALTEASDHEFIARLYRSGAGFVASSVVAYACARVKGVSLEKAT
ncbi:hypothetical protein [Roseibium sp.]|uniref:hypothetical protein n=1 Tax=Roseibium sp. TaxID=1936156 RepID=UPI0025D88A50|nr:hypothetical protein [Roseibium sp.]